jgi:dihydroorotase
MVEPGHLTWAQLIEKMTVIPARIMGLKGKGTLAKGSAADVTVIDVNEEWVIDPAKGVSKSRNTPFGGWRVKGRVKRTIVGGRLAFQL